MKFVFADSLDFVDPSYDFIADRNGVGRTIHRDDQFPHEFLDEAPYDGILVSRGIVGDALIPGKYTEAQLMRFRREGARRFLRFPREKFPDSMMMGDCGAFTYRNMPEPPYRASDTVEFYGDGGFTHGCSPDHLIFDFDQPGEERSESEVPEEIRLRFEITQQNAAEFLIEAKRLGRGFVPMGVIQGWSGPSMAKAASSLAKMGYDYLAIGGTVPLRIEQIRRVLAAIREVLPSNIRLHLLGFGKIEHLADLERYGVTSFDTTSPLVRAFKDARKNYWMRNADGELSYYTAIRIPQAIVNNKLKNKALQGRINQEEVLKLEAAALDGVRRLSRHEVDVGDALDAVMAYWDKLNWGEEASPSRRALALERQRRIYERTLEDRPWEACDCRVCREGGIEALIFRNSNRNKRRGMHNLHVFHRHLLDFRAEPV
ncbi:tRNA-guanine transglycosylase DpdA [Chelativorans salis]|uniref:tRNA-guanine transglycosylase DpdA n=1 Tax=Chelativorans salis TaxID=2978478 RepID=A0ABT2LP62_9HYPH|nr:tRNA-guanine transglycosylase DpdA [Chelativorans sp. EGI FJ00035]MCT7376355.1 tRNA-guanine transglycosylase DpdA [Chelativorans sp. EGI FJ00035]